jgi:hypothetical protein
MSKINRIWPVALGAGLATILMVGCGGNSGGSSLVTPPSNSQGTLVTFGGDAPICDVESFEVTITSASLVPAGGGSPVSLVSSTQPVTVDFARLVDFATILNTASVDAGKYSQLQMTLSNPEMTVLNTATTPPSPVAVTTNLTTQNFTIDINPALTITSNSGSALTMDFNLRKSVQTDANGQVTGTVDPQFSLTPASISGNGQLGEADDLYGVVQSVSTTSSNSNFTGSFTLQMQGGVGPILTIQVNGDTDFEGDNVTDLASLPTMSFVEVDAIVDTSGNIIADEVDVEDQVAASTQRSAFLGKIIGVTRDGNGNATQFNLLVWEEVPDLSGEVPLRSSLNVALQSETRYRVRRHHMNPDNFAYGPQTLGVAQVVGAYGIVQAGSPPSLNANSVYLRPRTVLGNFNTLLAAGSDGKTGGFTLTPCGDLFKAQPVTVLTFAGTNFLGVSDLVGLGPQPTLSTKGLLFYQETNGPGSQSPATWTAPTWTLEAKQVHQLPQ